MNATKERSRIRGITIDGQTSRDLDDAIWLTATENGWLLDVSIADVSSAIPLGSELDLKAREMGYTRYYARGNDPMFPRELSEDSLSLWEGKERETVTVSVPIARDLTIGEPEMRLTTLVSESKLSYDVVDLLIGKAGDSGIPKMLADLNNLAQALLEKRRKDGALVIYDIFSGWVTTEEGFLRKIDPEQRHLANIIIQECMILANRSVATFFAKRDIPVLFRNHTAKAIGADRSSLMADFNNAVADPKNFRIETIQAKAALVMNRATYGRVLEGHFGLNLPAYLHFTSPIRRYADLVNHRILLATLAGEKSPYSNDELADLGHNLTRIAWEIKDKRRQSEIHQAELGISKKVRTAEFMRLNGDEMNKAIKMASRSEYMTPEFEEEIVARVSNGQFLARDAYFVLLEASGAHEAWARLKTCVFDWLTKHPENAVSVLTLATQEKKAPSLPTFSLERSGPDHSLVFSGTASFTFDGQELVSETCVGSSKKQAQQFVCLSLIKLILAKQGMQIPWKPVRVGSSSPQPPAGVEIPMPAAASSAVSEGAAEMNAKNRLLELCQSERLAMPEFSVGSFGPDHMKKFKATAKLVRGGQTFISDPQESLSKKDAEKLAAASLLVKLGQLPGSSSSEKDVSSEVGGNFVAILQEFLAVRRISLPEYSFKQTGSPHMPTITCTCKLVFAPGDSIVREAKGQNNKIAKQRAAEEVWKALKARSKK